MRCDRVSSRARFAATFLMMATVQASGWCWGRLADQPNETPITQTAAADSEFGGYRISKRLAAPNAPLGGGRRPYPRLVFEDNQGRFWIAHVKPGGFVQLYDERTGGWDLFSSTQSDSDGIHYHGDALLPADIVHICQSKDGVMWFSANYASEALLAALKGRPFLTSFDGNQWRSFSFAARSNGFMGLVQGTDGGVWFWAMDEFRHWDRGRWSDPTRISNVLKDPAPHVPPNLTGTQDGQELQKRYEIIAAMQDREGSLWLSTHGGVLTYNPRTNKFRKYPDLRDTRAHPIYEDHQGRIWFNGGYGATMYNRSKGTVTHYNPLDHIVRRPNDPNGASAIRGICQDRRGRMIFASDEGLVILDEITNSWSFVATKGLGLDVEDVRNSLESIMQDSKGRIWLAGFTGIAILD